MKDISTQQTPPHKRSPSATLIGVIVALIVLLAGILVWYFAFKQGNERNAASNIDQPPLTSQPVRPQPTPVAPPGR